MNLKYDLGIVGSGPAGYTAALSYRKKEFSVVIFEKNEVGGVCLNRGCIPTKTILHSADFFEELKKSEDIGIFFENVSLDFSKVMARKNQVVERLRRGLELTLKNRGVVVIKAEAQIIDENTIKANGEIYKCSKIIAATGSEPRTFKGMEFDHKYILSSDDVLELTELPKSILIVGSGAIGIEWARIFSEFGCAVTVVELADYLLPVADLDVSKRIERIFKSKNIKIYKSVCVEKIEKNDICTIYLNNGEVIKADKVLVAGGRTIRNADRIRGVTYLGDACGEIMLAHFASKQAIEAAEDISFDKSLVPSVVYGTPEIAWVGKREQDLEIGTYQKSSMLISALGKSHCDNLTEGFIKLLSKDDKIIGAHIVSKEAASLIQEIVIAMQNNVSVNKLKEVCFAHPTYSEGIFESLFGL